MQIWLVETIRLIPGEGLNTETRISFCVRRIHATIKGREFCAKNPHSLFFVRPLTISNGPVGVVALLNEIIRLLEREK